MKAEIYIMERAAPSGQRTFAVNVIESRSIDGAEVFLHNGITLDEHDKIVETPEWQIISDLVSGGRICATETDCTVEQAWEKAVSLRPLFDKARAKIPQPFHVRGEYFEDEPEVKE